MVFGFMTGSEQTGTKKYRFRFSDTEERITRGGLQDKVEGLYTDFQHRPLEGAEAVLQWFREPQNVKILNDSESIQDVVLGYAGHKGPIAYFLEKAVEMQEAAGEVNPGVRDRFLDAREQYEALLAGVEKAKIVKEDRYGTKQYPFSFGKMTASQLQTQIEQTLIQYDKTGFYQEGAKSLINKFSNPRDIAILKESPNIRYRVFGGMDGKGPIDFFLDEAGEQLSRQGQGTHTARAQAEKLEALERRYASLRAEVLGGKQEIRVQAASHMLRLVNEEAESMGESRGRIPGARRQKSFLGPSKMRFPA